MKRLSPFTFGMTFAGSFIGAGYLSGQELWLFFGSFGKTGLLGLAVAIALLLLLGLLLSFIVKYTGITQMNRVLIPAGHGVLLRLSAALQLFFTFGVCAIMTAGGGALFHELLGLPALFGSALLTLLVVYVACRGLEGVIATFSTLVPLMIALCLYFAARSIGGGDFSLLSDFSRTPDILTPNAPVSCLLFAFYNFYGSVGILAPLAGRACEERKGQIACPPKSKNGRGLYAGVAAGAVILFVIASSITAAMLTNPASVHAEMPMLAVASAQGSGFGMLFGALLFLCMFGTSASMMTALITYREQTRLFPKLSRSCCVLLTGFLSFVCSLVGFGDLIGALYPIFGYCSILFIACMLRHAWLVRSRIKG